MKFNASISGVEDIDKLLSQIAPRQATNIMRSTVHGVAGELAKEARAIALDDPSTKKGDFKRSIKTKRERIKGGKVSSTVRVLKSAFYWRFLEYGTTKMPEKPTFTRVVESFRPKFDQVLREQFVKKFTATLERARKRQNGS